MKIKNFFQNLSSVPAEEVFEPIIADDSIKIERIISNGQATPQGQWLAQDKDEWVILLKGSAGIMFKDDDAVHVLTAGDYLHIKAHVQHRVQWTAAQEATVWLAVHYLSYSIFD